MKEWKKERDEEIYRDTESSQSGGKVHSTAPAFFFRLWSQRPVSGWFAHHLVQTPLHPPLDIQKHSSSDPVITPTPTPRIYTASDACKTLAKTQSRGLLSKSQISKRKASPVRVSERWTHQTEPVSETVKCYNLTELPWVFCQGFALLLTRSLGAESWRPGLSFSCYATVGKAYGVSL